MIHEDDIERGSGKPLFFDGINSLLEDPHVRLSSGIDWLV
jgi:hypothetical protein